MDVHDVVSVEPFSFGAKRSNDGALSHGRLHYFVHVYTLEVFSEIVTLVLLLKDIGVKMAIRDSQLVGVDGFW